MQLYKINPKQKILPFVTTFYPATPNLKKILMKHSWHLIAGKNTLVQIYPHAPIGSYRKEKSLKDFLVRAKILSL